MVRFRNMKRSPGGIRPWAAGLVLAATGPALAAPSPNETLNSAVTRELDALQKEMGVRPAVVDDEAAPRRLPGVDDEGVRPVSDQQPQTGATTQPAPTKPQPTPAQLEVMKKLEEMYKRDGREMPSMRIKDAPNTYLPKERMPTPKKSASTAPSMIQPASSPSTQRPTQIDSPRTPADQSRSSNNYSSLFDGKAPASTRKPSLLDRLRGKGSSKSASTSKNDGGLFGKLLSPFRPASKPQTLPPHHLPAPAPLPEYDTPANIAEQPFDAPRAFEQAPARPLAPQNVARSMSAPPAAPLATAREANPFAEAEESMMVISPARPHPFEDAFLEVRGEPAADIAFVAAIDPAFSDEETFEVDAPRTLDPETFADSEDFAPVAPEAAPAQITSQQATAARYAELQRKLAERSGLGGFQGFCPVALRDRRELLDARPEFLSIHEGRTYELASAEAKARFEADPAKYAPMSQGNDVVLVSRGELEAEGNLNFAVWFKDRLYLFRTAATLREFSAEPSKFAIVE
ncbi:MAG: hypothetical protein M3552_15255 [Planctomycetota bacterium]|nr:hypothetical protein [Planctomycetaceae bacterium]MDQ3331988.1 hypothetical protein [Planctomycetota bacterium]